MKAGHAQQDVEMLDITGAGAQPPMRSHWRLHPGPQSHRFRLFRLFRVRELAGRGCSASEPNHLTRLSGQKRQASPFFTPANSKAGATGGQQHLSCLASSEKRTKVRSMTRRCLGLNLPTVSGTQTDGGDEKRVDCGSSCPASRFLRHTVNPWSAGLHHTIYEEVREHLAFASDRRTHADIL